MRGEGYLLIDHRACVGAPLSNDPNGPRAQGLLESATRTCKHCQCIVVLNPQRTRERHKCFKCDGYICDGCAALKTCRPFDQILDQALTAATNGKPLPSLEIIVP